MRRWTPQKLPRWFESPKQEVAIQQELFAESLAEVLFRLKISRDDLSRWYGWQWISVPPDAGSTLQRQEVAELEFVSEVARSGFPDESISQILSQLPRPLNFNPDLMVYSFRYGWMQVVAWKHFNSPFDEVDDRVYEWLQQHPDSPEKEIVESLWSDLRLSLGTLEELGFVSREESEADEIS